MRDGSVKVDSKVLVLSCVILNLSREGCEQATIKGEDLEFIFMRTEFGGIDLGVISRYIAFKTMRFNESTKVVIKVETGTKDAPRPLGELFPHGPNAAAEFQPLCLLSMQEEEGRAKGSCHLEP